MGKGWKGGKGGTKGNGGGGGDISSCRGFPIIIGTCDAARERETSKELVNLFTQILESFGVDEETVGGEEASGEAAVSVQDLLAQELAEVRNKTHSGSQRVMSVQSGIKGIAVIKIMNKKICPLMLVKQAFNRVKLDRVPITRHVVRLIPLQRVFFPCKAELQENITALNIKSGLEFSSKSEISADPIDHSQIVAQSESTTATDPSLSEQDQGKAFAEQIATKLKEKKNQLKLHSTKSKLEYSLSYKARNHNVLTKDEVYDAAMAAMPPEISLNNRSNNAILIVEALKNICGVSFISDYLNLEDLNIRKYQLKYAAVVEDDSIVGTQLGKRKIGDTEGAEENADDESSCDSDA